MRAFVTDYIGTYVPGLRISTHSPFDNSLLQQHFRTLVGLFFSMGSRPVS